MKRRSIALCLALALCAALLSACHKPVRRSAFELPGGFDESTPVEITFWAKNDSNATQTSILQKAIADFEALYPNIKVRMTLYTDYSKIYGDVINNIITDTTPDVCISYPDHIAKYLTGDNIVVPLDDLMNDPDYGLGGAKVKFDAPSKEEIVPQFLQEGVIGDTQYALPFMRSTEALYINKDYVEKLGYEVPDVPTWDFVWEVSERAMEKGADGNFTVNGQDKLIPFIYKSTDNMMISMLRQLDAPYSNEDGEILIFNDTTESIMRTVYAHAGTRAFSTFAISSYPGNFMNIGQCIFAVDSTAGATWIGSDAPLMDVSRDNAVQFETVVRPIPQADPEHPQMISQGPSVCLFSKENKQQVLAGWLFIQYLLTNEVQIYYSETEGYVPVTSKAQESPEYQDYLSRRGEDNNEHYRVKIDASRLLLENTGNTFVTPVFNGSASLRQAAGQMIEEAAKAARRRIEMNDAFIRKVYADMNSLYSLNQVGANATRTEEELQEEGTVSASLPTESVVLLSALAGIWILIGIFRVRGLIRAKRKAGQKTA